MISATSRCAALFFGVALLPCGEFVPAAGTGPESPAILLSEVQTLRDSGGRNPNVAVNSRTGAVYLTWAQEAPAAATESRRSDPTLVVLLARSDDGGKHFEPPLVVSLPKDQVTSATVSSARVQVGPQDEVYVLYPHLDPTFELRGVHLRDLLRLVRSEDGARTFMPSATIGSEAVERSITSLGMANLFVAPDGALYASWLDTRETFAYVKAHGEWPSLRRYSSQLRVSRSVDGGRSFARSTQAAKPVCVCCGTKVAQGVSGPLYASTRGLDWSEAKGSVGSVRDILVARSYDRGATWSRAVKVHDDRFRIDTCPDVTAGLSVDSSERLHVAWYSGSGRKQGVFYAASANHGHSFSEPVALFTGESVPFVNVKLALDAANNAWVAFEERRGDDTLIHIVRISTDGSVSRSQSWPGSSPDLAGTRDGVIVTWQGIAPAGEEAGGGIFLRYARWPVP